MAKYYIVDTYTRISLKSSTPKFEANALSTRRNAHAHWYGKAHQILLIIAASIKKAHASVHACALARVFTARTHQECVHTHAHTCMHTCAYILCVYEQWRLWPVCARVHTCMGLLYGRCMGLLYGRCTVCTHAHTGQSLHCSYTQRVCAHTCAHLHAHMCIHSLCVWAVKTLASVRTCAHLHGPSLWTLHGPSLWTLRGMDACAHWSESSLLVHTKNVCTFVHASMQTCSHILCVYEQWKLWPVLAHVHTMTRVFTARTHKECVHTHAHTCIHTCAYIHCVCEQLRLWPMCARVHTCMGLLYGRCMGLLYGCCAVCTHAHTGQSLHCSYTQRMCAHLCMQVCKHVHTFFVCMSSEDSGQCAHMYTYWPESSLLLHTKNVCTHMRTLACTHVHTFFVCISSEDSDQCAHVCTLAWVFFMDAAWAFFMDAAWYARMRTLARVFTARTHKERVHICACKCAQMITHSLCVRAVKTLASVRTCAHTGQSLHCSYTFVCTSSEDFGQCAHMCTHWPESSLLVHTKNGSRWTLMTQLRHLAPLASCPCIYVEQIHA